MNTINDMQNRRDFLKTAAFAALGSGMAINSYWQVRVRRLLCSISIRVALRLK